MKAIKARVIQWISDRLEDTYIDLEKKSVKEEYHYFKIEGFCDEPEIFLVTTYSGLEFGYDSVIWDGPANPIPTKRITRKIFWESLNLMGVEEKKEMIIDTMLKVVTSKKREYRSCKYCKKKLHSNEFYDNTTCSLCAEKHLGIFIVY